MARPRKTLTKEQEKQLEELASIHCTIPEIAAVMGIPARTLHRRFGTFIKKGRRRGRSSLRRLQYQMAQAGNPTMAIWLGKQLLKQKDRQATELTGKDGGAIKAETTTQFDLSKLTQDELKQLREMRLKLNGGAPSTN